MAAKRKTTSCKKSTHKGIYYFKNLTCAMRLARQLKTKRVISYQRGWAIQRYISGPYWGPKGWN